MSGHESNVPTFNFPQESLRDRVVILAGGSGGLGMATADLLGREQARLVIGFLRNRPRAEELAASLKSRYGTQVRLVEGDLAAAATRARFLSAAGELGPVEGLVCFSGDPARIRFEDADAEDLLGSMSLNYAGPLLLARDVGLRMKEQGGAGSVVLLSTMQAVALFEGSFNYAAPKVALLHAARILAKQWGGPKGIRVNVVAPGVNRAGMALRSIESGKYDRFVEQGVIERFGRAEDVARAVRFLLEPDNYITGQVITVDGGLTLRGV